MKKSFLVLVILLAMIILPVSVNAGLESLINSTKYPCTSEINMVNKKVTTCAVVFKNTSNSTFNGGTLTLTLAPKNPSTTATFQVNDTEVKEVSGGDKVYTLNVEPINPGEEANLGTVTWTADATLSDIDCGGDILPNWNGTEEWDSSDGESPETGYAIPYIALAVGCVGVITVVATSKKNRKMYKI